MTGGLRTVKPPAGASATVRVADPRAAC